MYILAKVDSAIFPTVAVLYETIIRFADDAIANWMSVIPVMNASKTEVPAAAKPETHTATTKFKIIISLLKVNFSYK